MPSNSLELGLMRPFLLQMCHGAVRHYIAIQRGPGFHQIKIIQNAIDRDGVEARRHGKCNFPNRAASSEIIMRCVAIPKPSWEPKVTITQIRLNTIAIAEGPMLLGDCPLHQMGDYEKTFIYQGPLRRI